MEIFSEGQLLFLKLVKYSKTMQGLLESGDDITNVKSLWKRFEEEELVVKEEETIKLTPKGEKKLQELLKKEAWIEPENKSRIKGEIDKNAIFLPRRDELHF